MHFTFAPRHRQAVQTRPFPLWRSVVFIIGMACLGVWLMLAGMGVAHAGQSQELRAAAERLNSECRDNPKAVGACAARDGLLAQLKAGGTCWNAKAATPAALWVRCDPDGFTARAPALDRSLAQCAAQASKLDAITRFRDTAVPPRTVVEWGYSAADVRAVYSGQTSSYRGAAYCYTLRNIQDVRGMM